MRCRTALPAAAAAFAWIAAAGAAEPLDRETACIAAVAYAEAAGEGPAGMAAVVRVIRNRIADPRFPAGACAVVVAPGEFQPVGDSPRLRAALVAGGVPDLARALADFGPVDAGVLATAIALARAKPEKAADPTGGALYFVNPLLMAPAACAWFAALERTAAIGGHVFMTHPADEAVAPEPALDCAEVARHSVARARPAAGKRRGQRRVNPAWIVAVEPSTLAAGGSCRSGIYDPVTRRYEAAGRC
jgi:hypothetical protein